MLSHELSPGGLHVEESRRWHCACWLRDPVNAYGLKWRMRPRTLYYLVVWQIDMSPWLRRPSPSGKPGTSSRSLVRIHYTYIVFICFTCRESILTVIMTGTVHRAYICRQFTRTALLMVQRLYFNSKRPRGRWRSMFSRQFFRFMIHFRQTPTPVAHWTTEVDWLISYVFWKSLSQFLIRYTMTSTKAESTCQQRFDREQG